MSAQDDSAGFTRQIRLPSGRQIQVSYFERAERSGDCELSTCGACGCTLVQPILAETIGRVHWRARLRCPNCLWEGTAVCTEGELDGLERARENDRDVIRRELGQLSEANLHEDQDRLIHGPDEDQSPGDR